jgi:hypothetical protein
VERSPQANLVEIGRYFNIPHASVVLKEPVFSKNDSPLEIVNPFFDSMIRTMKEFSSKHDLVANPS